MKLITDTKKGIAYQEKRDKTIVYDEKYWDKLKGYENKPIDNEITLFRCNLVEKYCKYTNILDVGCGTGRFLKAYYDRVQCWMFGFDIMPETITWLRKNAMYVDPSKAVPNDIKGICFWDSLEHLAEPGEVLDKIKQGYVFVSIPIFKDITKVRESKHYRPNEHFWYFTNEGLIYFFRSYGFKLLERLDGEIQAGRENIYTYVFTKGMIDV